MINYKFLSDNISTKMKEKEGKKNIYNINIRIKQNYGVYREMTNIINK